MHVHYKPDAAKTVTRLLRMLQPDWRSGDRISDEVEEVLQALCIKPYIGHETVTAGGRDGRKYPIQRTCELEPDIAKVPTYDLPQGKFS